MDSHDFFQLVGGLTCDRRGCLCHKAPRNGSAWRHCPTHSDEHPSLSVTEKDGKPLVHCHAGCVQEAVVAALRDRGLWPGRSQDGRRPGPQVVASFSYHHADGKLLYLVERLEPGRDGRRKEFRQKHPAPDGQAWHWGLGGGKCGCPRVEPILYRLPELLAAPSDAWVFVPEGEKKVDRLCDLGLVATCNSGGAGKWPREFAVLKGRRVAVLPDCDEPGRRHALMVARTLHGVAAEIKVVELPGLADKGDVIDWLDAGHTKEELLTLAEAAPEWELGAKTATDGTRPGLRLTVLSALLAEEPESVSWVLDKTLPVGGLSLLAAKPKAGKSTLARNLAFAVARGDAFLGRATTKGPVVYLALEEKRHEVQSHFVRMGGTVEEVYIHFGIAPDDALIALETVVVQRKPVLVIVDPLLRFIRLKDANDYAEVTRALEPLLTIARHSGCHILCVHHAGKMDREGGDSILGSTALFGGVDTALIMRRKGDCRTLESIQRYGEDMPETVIGYDPQTGTVSADGTVAALELTRVRDEILATIGDKELTEPEIRELVEGRNKAKSSALRGLVADGLLVRTGDGRRGDPYRYAATVNGPPGGAAADSEISCTLVPNIYRGQAGQEKRENFVSGDGLDEVSAGPGVGDLRGQEFSENTELEEGRI